MSRRCATSAISCDSVATKRIFSRPALLDELHRKGVRLTTQRRVLVEVIQQATEHLDASSLLRQARLRDSGIDRATVYRTLELLKRLRLVDELDLMHLNGEKHYYEVRTQRDHIHLACFECGGILEFNSDLFEQLKNEIAEKTGFQAAVTRLEIGGRCRACRENAGRKTDRNVSRAQTGSAGS